MFHLPSKTQATFCKKCSTQDVQNLGHRSGHRSDLPKKNLGVSAYVGINSAFHLKEASGFIWFYVSGSQKHHWEV